MAKHLSLWPVFSLSKKRAGPSTESFLFFRISHSCPKPGRAPLAFFSLTDPLFPTGFDEKRGIQVKTKENNSRSGVTKSNAKISVKNSMNRQIKSRELNFSASLWKLFTPSFPPSSQAMDSLNSQPQGFHKMLFHCLGSEIPITCLQLGIQDNL